MNIAIINYGSGNLHSALKSFEAAASDFKNVSVTLTSCYQDVLSADKIVLPGVGSFAFCRLNLLENTDVHKALCDQVIENKKPFLGICVGMQLLATKGHEGQRNNAGLDWISGEVKKIIVDKKFKIPHMGWNCLSLKKSHPLFEDININDHFYFVHSYEFKASSANEVIATTEHSKEIVAAIAKDNIVGLQFHPEKSQIQGLNIIKNFIKWDVLR
ncbi:imidazole glycerol phosphate synthase subunit HisH [Paracoccaceae bacterium]|nr:imidazole glycerol phosphate synthase subunit HisH [Paracoccaceae bacterium]